MVLYNSPDSLEQQVHTAVSSFPHVPWGLSRMAFSRKWTIVIQIMSCKQTNKQMGDLMAQVAVLSNSG